ncbi:MAG: hypothetical protein ACI9HK_001101 [Pirellulaceae bacterium]|jgi:hypothetical protein
MPRFIRHAAILNYFKTLKGFLNSPNMFVMLMFALLLEGSTQ